MKKWKIFAVVSCLCFVVAACTGAAGFADETIRYKMTVTVETPEGIKTGSAVREAVRHTEPSIFPEQGGATYGLAKGEAISINLGNRGYFFVLLGGELEARLVFKGFKKKHNDGELVLQPNEYPRLVYFKDLKKPMTVQSISQYPNKAMPDGYGGMSELLSDPFGEGTKIESIAIATTSEPFTTNIGSLLGWLTSLKGGYLHGGPSSRGAPFGLHAGDFLR